jgi:hypothetical protein
LLGNEVYKAREFQGYSCITHRDKREYEILQTLKGQDLKIFTDHILWDNVPNIQLAQACQDIEPTIGEVSNLSLYDRAMYAWRAFGFTVLLHPDLTSTEGWESDLLLLRSVLKYKYWFFGQCFSKLSLDDKGHVVAPQMAKTIKTLKSLGAWITYYGAFNTESPRPQVLDMLPGQSRTDFQVLAWFDGCLSKWREPWLLEPNKHTVFCLAQMSGFGRALPPPPKEVLLAEGRETSDILSKAPDYDRGIIPVYQTAAANVFGRLKKPRLLSHVSISASACYENTTKDGGMAQWVIDSVNCFYKQTVGEYFEKAPELREDMSLYDPFGRVVFGPETLRPIARHREGLKSIPRYHPTRMMGQEAYVTMTSRGADDRVSNPRSDFSTYLDFEIPDPRKGYGPRTVGSRNFEFTQCHLNETLGDSVLFWAWTQSMEYGHFESDCQLEGYPLFTKGGVHKWIQDRPIPCTLMVLAEPGFKARSLTKNPAWLTLLQACLRHIVADVLSEDNRCGLGLKSAYVLWNLLKVVRNELKSNPRVFSSVINTDLSRSTDLIPMDLLRGMWKSAFGTWGYSPLFALEELIIPDHAIEYGGKSFTQACGSFMGEPMSFMSLTLYNLCTQEISSWALASRVRLPLTATKLQGYPLSTEHAKLSYDAIIGDDVMRLALVQGLGPYTRQMYGLTNGRLSKGKDTESTVHGILAENHVFLENCGSTTRCHYLDILKPRLLTASARYHSDNRSSLIGKGSMLYTQIEWYKDTNRSYQGVPIMALGLYNYILQKNLSGETRLWNQFLRSQVYFPASLGGIGIPISEDLILRMFNFELGFFKYLTECPFPEYILWFHRLKSVSARRKRRMALPDMSKIWKRLDLGDPKVVGIFDPEDKSGLYSMDSILTYYSSGGGTEYHLDISPVTGKTRVAAALQHTFETFGFMPVESLLDQWERFLLFGKAFLTGAVQTETLSLKKYLTNLKGFWHECRKAFAIEINGRSLFEGKEVTECPKMKDLSWAVAQRSMTLVHRDMTKESILAMGPTLNVDLDRIGPVGETKLTHDRLIDQSVKAWLQGLSTEDDEVWEEEAILDV